MGVDHLDEKELVDIQQNAKDFVDKNIHKLYKIQKEPLNDKNVGNRVLAEIKKESKPSKHEERLVRKMMKKTS